MRFKYKARNPKGDTVSGFMAAESQEQAAAIIRQRGLVPLSFENTTQKERESIMDRLHKISTVSLKDKAVLFRQLATMISAGINLGAALEILGSQTKNKRLAASVKEVKKLVDGGMSLSAAMVADIEGYGDGVILKRGTSFGGGLGRVLGISQDKVVVTWSGQQVDIPVDR